MGMAMARLNKLYQKQAKGNGKALIPKLNMAIPKLNMAIPATSVRRPDKVMQVNIDNNMYCYNFSWSNDHNNYINTQLNCTLAMYNKYRFK